MDAVNYIFEGWSDPYAKTERGSTLMPWRRNAILSGACLCEFKFNSEIPFYYFQKLWRNRSIFAEREARGYLGVVVIKRS